MVKFPKEFEKEYLEWDEETKKRFACLGWVQVLKFSGLLLNRLGEFPNEEDVQP